MPTLKQFNHLTTEKHTSPTMPQKLLDCPNIQKDKKMRLVFNLKPYTEFSGKGTKKDALMRLDYDYRMSAFPNCFSTRGDYNTRGEIRGNYAWYYTIQVYKRGKHRKDKHYSVKIYRVPFEVMDALKIKMTQKRNGIKIEKR